MSKPARADECECLVRILSDAPSDGLSLEEIREKTSQGGEVMSYHAINDVLCDLRMSQNVIACHKVRTNRGKCSKYYLKLKGQS